MGCDLGFLMVAKIVLRFFEKADVDKRTTVGREDKAGHQAVKEETV